MNNVYFLLDACTVINLIHLEDTDFLLRRIDKLSIRVIDVVYQEIRNNVSSFIRTKESLRLITRKEVRELTLETDQKVKFFRKYIYESSKLKDELGGDYINLIKSKTGYGKRENGELYSVALALYLNRNQSSMLVFYTDDYPAKEDFVDFFEFQQIGQIKDSIDLLLLLCSSSENFNLQQLDNYLSALSSIYTIEVTLLKGELRKLYNRKFSAKSLKKNKEQFEKMNQLIQQLDKLEFAGINSIKEYFNRKKKDLAKDINRIINAHLLPFELEGKEDLNLIAKIKATRKRLESESVLSLLDLC